MTRIEFEITEQQGVALAKFLAHHTVRDYLNCGASDVEQAYLMRDACEKLRAALNEAGFGPR